MERQKQKVNIRVMTKVAILAGVSFVLFQFKTPLPFFPPFLKLDISDLPALVGAFALGPITGFLITFVKNTLHLFQTNTAGVGELSNFVVASVMVCTASRFYYKKKTFKRAIIGMLMGVGLSAVVAGFTNYFIMLPFFERIMPMEAIVNLTAQTNSLVTDKISLVVFSIMPFNILKFGFLSVVTAIIYKRISALLK